MRKILLFGVLFGLTSCQPIIKLFYGIKNPKVENEQTLTKYMSKKDINKDNVYTVDFDNYQTSLESINSKIPEVFIFNKKGQFIPYGEEYACNASAFSFIENLNKDSSYNSTNNTTLDRTLIGLCDLKGQPRTINTSDNTDFFVFIYWTRWAGKLNKDHVKVWEQQALSNDKADIKVVKINMDFQEFWGEENLNKIKPKKE